MFLKQQRYKDKRTGQTKRSRKYTIFFVDHRAVERHIPGFLDKEASEHLGRQVARLVAFRAANQPPDRSMARWLESLPFAMQRRLVGFGVLDPERAAAAKPLVAHVEDFRKYLLSKGNTAEYCARKAARILRAVDGCGFFYFSDIRSDVVQQFVVDLKNHEGKPIGPQTCNFYIQAVQQFCRWMVRTKRASESPVRDLEMRNVAVDQRRERRALSKEEFQKLLEVAHYGPVGYGVSGPERALLYLFAAETGLRASEMRSLTRSSFDFDAEPPTATVKAAYSKHRRKDIQPLRPELAEMLRAHLADRLPRAPAFNMPRDNERVPMLRADEEAAGIEYRDAEGRYADFHALRHTFLTNLARSGVHPKVAQKLARHSTIRLTMDRYTHAAMDDQTAALAKLPTFRPSSKKGAKKTGTTDAPEEENADSDLPPHLPEHHGNERISVDSERHHASCAEGRREDATPSPVKDLPTPEGEEDWRRRPDLNRCMRVLQTLALPLGYAAL